MSGRHLEIRHSPLLLKYERHIEHDGKQFEATNNRTVGFPLSCLKMSSNFSTLSLVVFSMILICVCLVNVNVGLNGIARYAVEVCRGEHLQTRSGERNKRLKRQPRTWVFFPTTLAVAVESLQFLRCKQLNEDLSDRVAVVIVEQ